MLFNQRLILRIAVACMAAFGLLVVIRLIHIQGLQGKEFQLLAERNRLYAEPIPAERGVFLDRYDQPLVRNIRRYAVVDSQAVFSSYRFVSQQEALALEATQSGTLRYQLVRKYAFPTALAHVLGYTGAMTREALRSDARKLITDQTGVLGLEKRTDGTMLGRPGKLIYEVNALGSKQRLLQEHEPEPGKQVATTLDPILSQVTATAMRDLRGAVVIMDAQNGQVLTLFSNPTFNSNDFQALSSNQAEENIRLNKLQEYFSDENKVFFNRAISGMYPPGSVFKLVTALSALENQAVQTNTTVEDQGILRVGEYTYANWYYTQHGRVEGAVNLEKALARSNDIYFYKAAEWLGPNQLAKTARLYGLGRPTGIELYAEAAGLVPDPAWKEKTLGEPWYLGNTFHFGIGQGDVLVTPLQVAQMTQAIANNQSLCVPTLLRENTPECHDLGVSSAATDTVLAGMLAACSDGGTGYPLFQFNRTYFHPGTVQEKLTAGMVACKTGTAEFGGVDARNYRKTHAWFTAIIPTGKLLEAYVTPQQGELTATSTASLSQETADLQQLHSTWVRAVQQHGFPKRLVVAVLVESSDAQPYAEGSRDAAPIVAFLLDWMAGKTTVLKQ
jgi:penicillin-binding protein 2